MVMLWKLGLRIPFAVLKNSSQIYANSQRISPTRFSCSAVATSGKKKLFAEVNEFKIHYKIFGEGENTLLLVPGIIGCMKTDFEPIIPDILKTEKFRIVAFDPPGYGFSRPPNRDYSGDFFHRDGEVAAILMGKLGIKKYYVFGWSTGGVSAAFMAADHPDRVIKLVTLGSPGYVDPGRLAYIKSIGQLENWPETLKNKMILVYGQTYFEQLLVALKDGYETYHHSGLGSLVEVSLKKICCPTLILHGDKDPVVGTEHSEFIHRCIRGSIVRIIAGGTHNVHLKQPTEFLNLVIPFFLNGYYENNSTKSCDITCSN